MLRRLPEPERLGVPSSLSPTERRLPEGRRRMPMGLRRTAVGTVTVVWLKGTGALFGSVMMVAGGFGLLLEEGNWVEVVVTGSSRPLKTVVVVMEVVVECESCCRCCWGELGSGKLGKGSLAPSRSRGLVDRRDEAMAARCQRVVITATLFKLLTVRVCGQQNERGRRKRVRTFWLGL